MNRFRITLLVFLFLALGVMFYAVTVVIPSQQRQYIQFQNEQRDHDLAQRSEDYRNIIKPAFTKDSEQVAQIRAQVQKNDEAREQAINEAEENSIIAAARRKEEYAQAKVAEEQATAPKPIGLVASYSPEWNAVMVKPVTSAPINIGVILAVRREGRILCELVVDNTDEESGQISASIKNSDITPSTERSAKNTTPAVGDEVIVSPFPSSQELRSGNQNAGFPAVDTTVPFAPAPVSIPTPPSSQDPGQAQDNQLPEIDATLVPIH